MRAILRDSELLVGRAVGQKFYRENKTEAYVCVPPALIITDSNGATWTIGRDWVKKGWVYYWSVLRNDFPTGEFAERIEYRRGKVYITTPTGRKVWTERATSKIQVAPGYWL
jgi:hypothetical protein